MGIIKKTRNTESLLSAERKVCKRIWKPPRSLRKRFRRLPCVTKVFKAAAFAAIWVVPRSCLRPNVIFMAGMEAFFIFCGFHRLKTLLN